MNATNLRKLDAFAKCRVAASRKNSMIKVGLRYNASTRKFWVSGVDEKNKNLLKECVDEDNKDYIEYCLHKIIFVETIGGVSSDEQSIKRHFENLSPEIVSLFKDFGIEIEISETEIVNLR
jgi:hypothetical protein